MSAPSTKSLFRAIKPRPKVDAPDTLRELLAYNPETGELFWRERPEWFFNETAARTAGASCRIWNGRFAGKPALTHLSKFGYLQGRIFGKGIQAHRAAWAVFYGAWPEGDIDHENGVRSDNRISNLRDVTRSENLKNRRICRRNRSGVVGVRRVSSTGRWCAQITSDGEVHSLGTFTLKSDAVAARKAAEQRFGFHPNHGRPMRGDER